jgi:hypothetical protein
MTSAPLPLINGNKVTPLLPYANRLAEGRAIAEDVWSIYKCVLRLLAHPYLYLSEG